MKKVVKLERIVKLIAIDRKYKDKSYEALPAYDPQIDNYLTGQHFDPNWPESKEFLTKDEMLGKEKISEERRKQFGGYIINPTNHISLSNQMKFNLTTGPDSRINNQKDRQIFNFVRNFVNIVAPSKASVNRGIHKFYLEDKEDEAMEYNTKEDLIFEAEQLIRKQCPVDRYNDMALLLNHKMKNFSINTERLSDNQIKSELIKVCKSNPEDVINCFGPKAEEDLYILKLVHYNILTVKEGSYFDGLTFIGDSIDKVRAYIKNPIGENAKMASKWGKLMLEHEGKIPSTMIVGEFKKQTNEPTTDELLARGLPDEDKQIIAFKNMDSEMLKTYAIGKKYPKVDYDALDENQFRQYLIDKYNSSKEKK